LNPRNLTLSGRVQGHEQVHQIDNNLTHAMMDNSGSNMQQIKDTFEGQKRELTLGNDIF